MSKATILALVTAILGTAFLAGSVFAITAQSPHILLMILFTISGFIGWILPYFLYKKILQQETERLNPIIEKI